MGTTVTTVAGSMTDLYTTNPYEKGHRHIRKPGVEIGPEGKQATKLAMCGRTGVMEYLVRAMFVDSVAEFKLSDVPRCKTCQRLWVLL